MCYVVCVSVCSAVFGAMCNAVLWVAFCVVASCCCHTAAPLLLSALLSQTGNNEITMLLSPAM